MLDFDCLQFFCLWVENKPLWCWVSIKFIGYRNLLRPEKTAEISFGSMNGCGLISFLQSDLNVLFSMCVREVKVCINRIWKTGASHSQHVFIQPVHYENPGVQNEAPTTLVTPFNAENEITAKESHNPQWTETGFQPNSSSLPPSNNTQSHQPLTLKRHETQRVEEKQPARLRGRPSPETKEKTGSMRWRTHKTLVLFFW